MKDNRIENMNINFSELNVKEIHRWVEGKAYEFYLARGRKKNQDWQNWFDAEKVLMQELLGQKSY